MRVVRVEAVDKAFRLAQEIQGRPVEFHLIADPNAFAAPHSAPAQSEQRGRYRRYSFDHAVMDARSALLLLSAGEVADRVTVPESVLVVGRRDARVPRRRLRRMVRRLATIPVPFATEPGDAGPLFFTFRRDDVPAIPGRSMTADIVARIHRLALSKRKCWLQYSAILVPVDARPAERARAIGNFSSSELSIASTIRGVDGEIDWFFPRLRRGRDWALFRLGRYGELDGVARWLVVRVARLLRIPRETAIVSHLRIDAGLLRDPGTPVYFEVPTRSEWTLSVGVVEAGPWVHLCLGSSRMSSRALRSVLSGILPEICD